ncbi:hypothetical protein, partial [Streptomyces leeuwenhoekii]|uniref:hypothetical protein n=1 Tax=Streptomyces leeuwenhoekii TaxID=1437453 RepID=UPI0018FE2F71
MFAEVVLPEGVDAGGFGVHPALLEAAVLSGGPDVGLPLEWRGLVVHAVGASVLRVRLVVSAAGGVSVEAADEAGGLVVSAESVVFGPVSVERPGLKDALFRVEWVELPAVAGEPSPSWSPVVSAGELPSGMAVLEADGGQESPLSLT